MPGEGLERTRAGILADIHFVNIGSPGPGWVLYRRLARGCCEKQQTEDRKKWMSHGRKYKKK
jgi:hypothetical protein